MVVAIVVCVVLAIAVVALVIALIYAKQELRHVERQRRTAQTGEIKWHRHARARDIRELGRQTKNDRSSCAEQTDFLSRLRDLVKAIDAELAARKIEEPQLSLSAAQRSAEEAYASGLHHVRGRIVERASELQDPRRRTPRDLKEFKEDLLMFGRLLERDADKYLEAEREDDDARPERSTGSHNIASQEVPIALHWPTPPTTQ